MQKKVIFAVIIGTALGQVCFAQRLYTVAPVPGPAPSSTTYNAGSWISDDGSVVFGALYDTSIKDSSGNPVVAGQCYISTKGNAQVFPTPGYNCNSQYWTNRGFANDKGNSLAW